MIDTVKGFGIVKKAEIDVFLENLDLSTNIKDFKGGKKARLKEEGGGDGRGETGEGGKRGGLTDISCHLHIARHYRTLPWTSREGRTGTRPYQKSDQTRTRLRVLCQEEVISLQSSAQAEALQPDSCIQEGGTEKEG